MGVAEEGEEVKMGAGSGLSLKSGRILQSEPQGISPTRVIEEQAKKIERLKQENFSLTVRFEYMCERNKALGAKINELQGNFSHFHVDNEMNELCALCGLAVINQVHLRSR